MINKISQIEQKCEAPYPIYKASKQNGLIVKFVEKSKGYVVVSTPLHPVGQYGRSWVRQEDGGVWRDLNDTEKVFIKHHRKDLLLLD